MTHTTQATVATLWRYPVKSMMGEELNGSHVTASGILGDRAFALVDLETGNVISAKNPKKWPNFFTYRAAFSEPLQTNQLNPVWISLPDGSTVRSDQADVNDKLSAALGHRVELRTQAPQDAKLEQYWPEYDGQANEISSEAVAGDAFKGSFFDYAAIHLLTTSTLDAMQSHYPAGRFEVRRFRPNIMVDTQGMNGFVENDWVGKVIKIGDSLRLQITDPCPRCVMPTLAQGDLPQDNGIFKHGIAKNKPAVPFAGKELPSAGVYARVVSPGWVKKGDAIQVE